MGSKYMRCVYCGDKTDGEKYAVHRDGFGVGPEVPLCDRCGEGERPTMREIWDRIAQPADGEFAYRRLEKLDGRHEA